MTTPQDKPYYTYEPGRSAQARVTDQVAKDLRILAVHYKTANTSDIVRRALHNEAEAVRQLWTDAVRGAIQEESCE